MVNEDLIVNTMPPRSAEDTVTQEGGVLRARTSPPVEPPALAWNPFQELDAEERVHVRVRAHFHSGDHQEDIPEGMEGSYYL